MVKFPLTNQIRSTAFASARLENKSERVAYEAAIHAEIENLLTRCGITWFKSDYDWELCINHTTNKFYLEIQNSAVRSRKSFLNQDRWGEFNWNKVESLLVRLLGPKKEEREAAAKSAAENRARQEKVDAFKKEFPWLPFDIRPHGSGVQFTISSWDQAEFNFDEARRILGAIISTGITKKWNR